MPQLNLVQFMVIIFSLNLILSFNYLYISVSSVYKIMFQGGFSQQNFKATSLKLSIHVCDTLRFNYLFSSNIFILKNFKATKKVARIPQ